MSIDWNRLSVVLNTYSVNEQGIITDCGKYESEHLACVYYDSFILEGSASETVDHPDGSVTYVLEMESDEAGAFGVPDAKYCLITEYDLGFVSAEYLTESQFRDCEVQWEMESAEEEEEEEE